MAINLLHKYGRSDAVFFYSRGIEVDFYIPDESLAIQVCYNLDNSDGTFEREINALLKLSNVLEIDHKTIEVVSVWKMALELVKSMHI